MEGIVMKEILWLGRGGQGAFTAAKLLGAAFAAKGEDAYSLAFPSFGPERRGAPVRAFTKLDDKPILDRSETEQYIRSHLVYAGCDRDVFSDKALDEIFKVSTGIPRMINRICEKSLMYSFQQQKRIIDDYMVKYVTEHEMLTGGA
jgi:hypothetical protein